VGFDAMKSDVELRQQVGALRRDERNGHAIAHILATYVLMGGNFWLLANYPGWLTWVFSFLFMGFMQYRLVMSTHEATHKTLLFPEKLNEFFGAGGDFVLQLSPDASGASPQSAEHR
jgi:fatty acid desaturase